MKPGLKPLFYSTEFIILPPLKDSEAGKNGLSEVITRIASHIPDKSPVMIRYYS